MFENFLLIKFNISFLSIEEPGFKGFDSPVYPGEFDDNFENAMEREQSPGIPEENFELYKKNLQMHDQNQEKIVSIFVLTLDTALK